MPVVLRRYWQQLEHSYQPDNADHVEAVTAITTITGGNFRLIERLITQIARVMTINGLHRITPHGHPRSQTDTRHRSPVQGQRPSALAGSAQLPQRASAAGHSEGHRAGGGDGAGHTVRAGHRVVVVDGESSMVKPPATAGRSGKGFDDRFVPGSGQLRAGLPGSVGGIGQHLHRAGLGGQQVRADGGITTARTGRFRQFAVGDDPGVRFDGDVGLEAVLAAVHRLVGVPGVRVDHRMTRSGATRRAICHRPSVPSEPSTGSTS